jgi:hypothetical protein
MFPFFFRKRITAAMLPEVIETPGGWVLTRQVSRLELSEKGWGIDFVRFETKDENGVNLSLHPPKWGRVELSKWAGTFDLQAGRLRETWREVLAAQPKEFELLFARYGETSLRMEDLVGRLLPSTFKIVLFNSVELGFEPFAEFPSLNLEVELTSDLRVKNVTFEG